MWPDIRQWLDLEEYACQHTLAPFRSGGGRCNVEQIAGASNFFLSLRNEVGAVGLISV